MLLHLLVAKHMQIPEIDAPCLLRGGQTAAQRYWEQEILFLVTAPFASSLGNSK